MKVGVFSDTHGSLTRLPEALLRMGTIDAVLHLGDYGTDAAAIGQKANAPCYVVRGNCDFSSKFPAELVVELAGARLLLVHGDRFRDVYALSSRANELCCGAVLFGHTHEPLLRASGKLLIINPGSLSRPRFGTNASCALLTIEDGDIDVDMISLQR